MKYRLARPIQDNRRAFASRFPGAKHGDVGDPAHMQGDGDHTPHGGDVIFGQRNHPGVIYAEDFGEGGNFDAVHFTRWLLDRLRLGDYPEVKYVISRLPANRGVNGGRYFGLFDRRYGWRTQRSTGHTSHVHVSYMPNAASTPSRLVEDFYQYLHSEEFDMAVETELVKLRTEMAALNDFLMTGQRYGKSATAPPDSQYIGLMPKQLQSIDDRLVQVVDLLEELVAQGRPVV